MYQNITSLQQELVYLLQNAYEPLLLATKWGAIILGFCLMLNGVHRLKHHGHGMQQKSHSPTGTAFFFIAGAALLSFNNMVLLFSQSLFGNITDYLPTDGQATVAYYVNSINSTADQVTMIEDFTFGILVTIGVLSFIRGMVLLVKLGEGQGEGTLPKALTHILAGAVGVDASGLYHVLQNFISS